MTIIWIIIFLFCQYFIEMVIYMNSKPFPDDQTIRFNLSFSAEQVIETDRYSFFENKTDTYMINTILELFFNRSFVSNFRKADLADYNMEFTAKTKALLRDNYKPYRIRIQNRVWERIKKDTGNDLKVFNGSIGNAVRLIVEEYAQLPYSEREKILLSEIFNTINQAIKTNSSLTLTTTAFPTAFIFKPYKILTNSLPDYNYVLGKEKNKILTLRLSRITSAYSTSVPGLTSTEKQSINEIIKEKGILYLSEDQEKVDILLTKEGYRMYRQIQHLRPNYINKSPTAAGEIKLSFICTSKQISDYFLKFGKEAYVISPKSLQKKFFDFYKSAFGLYSNNRDAKT